MINKMRVGGLIRVFQLERQEKILQYVNEKRTVRTRELCEKFNASPVTIRADINDLANRGLIIKSHGGALSIQNRMSFEIPTAKKSMQDIDAKKQIGELAAAYIMDHDVVILDAGTTSLEVARRITSRDVTVITNDIKIADELSSNDQINLFVTGGMRMPTVCTLVGDETTDFLKRIKADKFFLGCDAIDFEWGISNRTFQEISIKKAMIAASKEVIAIASSLKFHRQVFAHLCSFDEIDMLITDQIDPESLDKLAQHNVRCVSAKGSHTSAFDPQTQKEIKEQ